MGKKIKGSKMISLFVILFFLVSPFLYSCGGGGGGSSSSGGGGGGGNQTPAPLTQSEKDAINKAIEDTVKAAYSSGKLVNLLAETDSVENVRVAESITTTPTDCEMINNMKVCHSVTLNIFNERRPCTVSGRSTTNGNMKASDTGAVSGQFTIQFSDPTNNLNDCEFLNGLFIKGPVYIGISGNAVNGHVTLTVSGDVEIARRGPTGGLVPIDSKFGIFFTIII